MHLGHASALDEIVNFAHCRVTRQILEVVKQALQFTLKEPAVDVMLELLIPERADKYFGALGHGQHLGDGPHEGAVHPHELLMVDLVRLVEDDPHFVLVPVDRLDRAPEFVRDVELVGVEQEDDAIHALGEPLQHPDKVVAPVRPLLFARQYTWKMSLVR